MSSADELKKLKDLLDSGVLTQDEFDIQKSKILSSESSDEREVIIDDNKSKKNNSIFKWVIGIVVIFAIFTLFSSNDLSSSTTTGSNSTSENNNVNTISSTNTTDACYVYVEESLEVTIILTDIVQRFNNQTTRFLDAEISSDEYLGGLESDYYLLMSTYFVQMDLEPPSVYEEKHQYRLKETESYILMYEWMIKAIEELNEDYIELAFTYLDDAIDYLELSTNLEVSC